MDGSRTTAHEARPAITNFEKAFGQREGRVPDENLPPFLTTVITEFKTKDCHHRILFGAPVKRVIVFKSQGHLRVRQQFLPGSRFVLDLWRRNDYGTLQWRCFVCETVAPGETAERVPKVNPGARVLLATKGASESRAFLSWLYAQAQSGVDVLTMPREAFEAAHFRLKGSRMQGLNPNTLSGVL